MDAHHSLFHTRNQHAISPEIANLSFNGIPTPFLVSDILFWDKDVSQSIINKRGWVLQERLLSPRVIHFGAHQLLWECCTKDAAEIYPNGLPLEIFGPRGRIKTLAPNYLLGVQNNGGNLAVYEAWARIVQAYTACDLTFPSDKLVAISGIAKMVRSILNDEYVAGMWRLHLDREILWVRSPAFRPDGPGILDSPYRAPTWSWAAVDGKVSLGHIYIQDASILLRVEHVELQHVSGDPMGRICGGYLKLSGVLKKLVLLPHFPVAKGFESWEMVINGTHFRAFDDSSMEEPPFRVYLDRSRSTNGSDLGSEHLFCMPARVRDGPSGSIYVLLLEALDTTKGVFRRIGIARGWGTDVKAKILSQGVHVGEDGFPCERYSDGQHTILVV
ncbi:heterokaryon incompatibility protein-domain-containing protein [Apiospora arundinis]|uniref:Heterokaryon incompatibility protein-domain-containing protein n=1 Tax=Apiospora arundinis TaxID=335852 RepID=A0ABR2IA25_9PEZI